MNEKSFMRTRADYKQYAVNLGYIGIALDSMDILAGFHQICTDFLRSLKQEIESHMVYKLKFG